MSAALGGSARDDRRRILGVDADAFGICGTALLFMAATGVSSVALPLRALDAGHGAGTIGVLVALGALVQIGTRARLAAVLRRMPDRVLVRAAPVAQLLTFGVAVLSASLVALGIAWMALAFGRACFWTGAQTHAVRGEGSAIRGLARLNFFGTSGSLTGPLLAGVFAEYGIRMSLLMGAALSVVGILPTLALKRYPPFARMAQRQKRGMWRRPGVGAGCWAGVTAGAWRGLMDGYVSVVLEEVGYSSTVIGVLVSVANGTSVIGTVIIGRLRESWVPRTYVLSVLAASLGLAALGVGAGVLPVAAVTLAVCGLGAGILMTLGPNLAAGAVEPDEKGDAMTTYGAVRTSAMFLAPLAVAGGVVVLPVSIALLIVGASLSIPGFAVRSLKRVPAAPPAAA